MIFTIIETIRINLKSDIIERIEEENKIEKENFKYKYECKKLPDQTYWICRLFSDFKLPINANLANLRDKLKKGFRKPDGSSDADSTAKDILGKWNSTRFSKFMDTIGQTEKTALITSINEIDTVKIETVDDIPILLKEQFENLSPPKKTPKEDEENEKSDSTSKIETVDDIPILLKEQFENLSPPKKTPKEDEENEKSDSTSEPSLPIKRNVPFIILIVIILILIVMFSIILLIIFRESTKVNPDIHVDNKILVNSDTTTSLASTTTTVSTEISLTYLTHTNYSIIETSAVISEATTISTPLPITTKNVGNGNKNDPYVIVVTINGGNDSHSITETHTESPQSTTHQETPVTQPPVIHTPITTYIQEQRTDPTLPDITISSIEANKGQSDVCVKVVFSDLTLKGDYDKINLNFNVLYDNNLILKTYTISQKNAEVNELDSSNGNISFNMSSDCCENDITVNLFFDVPDSVLDGDYVVYMPYEASHISLLKNTYNFFYNDYTLSTFKKYDSLYRYGVIQVS